jgi:hypothetical protein
MLSVSTRPPVPPCCFGSLAEAAKGKGPCALVLSIAAAQPAGRLVGGHTLIVEAVSPANQRHTQTSTMPLVGW